MLTHIPQQMMTALWMSPLTLWMPFQKNKKKNEKEKSMELWMPVWIGSSLNDYTGCPEALADQ